MLNGWKIAARTNVRTSLCNEKTGETVEILYHDGLCDEYDLHAIMYSASQKADSFTVLQCDGLFEIDYSHIRVSPPPSASQLSAFERPVSDHERRDKFFARVGDALWSMPKKAVVERVLEHAKATRPAQIPSDIAFLDLGCGNGARVRGQAGQNAVGNAVGVDLHPPIFNDCSNASFFRGDAGDFLQTLRQRQNEPAQINADFLLGRLSEPERTKLVEEISQRIGTAGKFTFCESVTNSKKIVQTVRMFPGLQAKASGFGQSAKWIGATSKGRAELSKFLEHYPQYAAMAGKGAEGDAASGQEQGTAKEEHNAAKGEAGHATEKSAGAPTSNGQTALPSSMPILVTVSAEPPKQVLKVEDGEQEVAVDAPDGQQRVPSEPQESAPDKAAESATEKA